MVFNRALPVLASLPAIVGVCSEPSIASDISRPFLQERVATLAPFAHVRFCLSNPDQCVKGNGASVILMTPEIEQQIETVNSYVNQEIRPERDTSAEEDWRIDVSAGDCNDYAVTKRKDLIDRGFPIPALRLAVAMTPQGVGHTVLIVRTTRGDLVLDNRTADIKTWSQTGLRWLKIESATDPHLWFAL
jgi:predicted transglutaminase-like cysteine proteinase